MTQQHHQTYEAQPAEQLLFKHRLIQNTKNHLTSPTDNLMSPCTQKLIAKRNSHVQSLKPRSLSQTFAAAADELGGSQPL
ncbi:hypothetical protein K493DRAFT_313456 [Basidiobolus meristosporus CBS 931.73]|uniref:Uncharacterized protein n=1 Tax=Basidiobolus meristosporus CBS 931.73 TaxID=1314790 RepID=A0A1Y1YMD9_9FUNG|nr:hypothetical protein K493DRAFT_313456 [Basidiobolus meristosporus CBS 931.73]|eukprot:ORX98926.1 hypothetical protein K493DRAFT_313456 [Basidiobolus meristosporus CBS 931.73]